ncbi:MAG: divalent-cation tolerance protein CutA [Wenzhouxiangellaceae bacterium]
MANPSRLLLVHTTVGDREQAARIGRTLVEEHLAACVSIVDGAESIYPWQGRIERARETGLLIKTTASGFETLARRLRELHPYELPELLATEVVEADPGYAQWLRDWIEHKQD